MTCPLDLCGKITDCIPDASWHVLAELRYRGQMLSE